MESFDIFYIWSTAFGNVKTLRHCCCVSLACGEKTLVTISGGFSLWFQWVESSWFIYKIFIIWCHIYLNVDSRILLQWASRREWAGRLDSVSQSALHSIVSAISITIIKCQSCQTTLFQSILQLNSHMCCDDVFAWLLQVHIIWTWSIYLNLKAKAEESLKELVR